MRLKSVFLACAFGISGLNKLVLIIVHFIYPWKGTIPKEPVPILEYYKNVMHNFVQFEIVPYCNRNLYSKNQINPMIISHK